MRLSRLRICGFRCAGKDPVELTFEDATFLLGPNGSGKTAFLHALARMFGSEPGLRRFNRSDFHVPVGKEPLAAAARSLWLEAEFAFPELVDDGVSRSAASTTVPPHFSHMRMNDRDSQPTVRFRLSAELNEAGEVTPGDLVYVLETDSADEPTRTAMVNRHHRSTIQVHYLPARRNPSDHVSYAANSVLGRLLRAADWQAERDTVNKHGRSISDALAASTAVEKVVSELAGRWDSLHPGPFLTTPGMSFVPGDIDGLLRYVSLEFSPGPGGQMVDFSLLSDGQQSLLYLALVMTAHAVGKSCLDGTGGVFDIDLLRPPVFTLLAMEEPENSLSPHYLGRVLTALTKMAGSNDAQVVVATHSASLMRRVEPRQVRYLRLNEQHHTIAATVKMPSLATEEYKFVREALHAYPELYFARLVILGEGDSEEIVLPRCLRTMNLEADATSISVVPLGGRHVNHFWRLLNGLNIPHVTLLDLDTGRHQGGWGRIKYAATQLIAFRDASLLDFTAGDVEDLHRKGSDVRGLDGRKWIDRLEAQGVFFSEPMDLDFAMLQSFSEAYGVRQAEKLSPDSKTIASVLGEKGSASSYTELERLLFPAYSARFKGGGSKPAGHLSALSTIKDVDLRLMMPAALNRLVTQVNTKLKELPE